MAENPYVNKVVYGDQTLIDLTADTVTPETLVLGATAHDASGGRISGNVDPIGLHVSGATVDDLVRVKTVDNNGKPTSWKPVPLADLMTKDNFASDVQKSLGKADTALQPQSLAPPFTATMHKVGDYAFYNGNLYRCTQLYMGAWNDNYWTQINLSDDVKSKYVKPSSGIPKTDLTSDVQASLDKADTAIQLGLTSASVGDLVRVASIDTNGKPTSWKKVSFGEIRPNPNLFINWYFAEIFPINQRGQNVYVNDGACYDKWRIQKVTNCSIGKTAESDYVTLTAQNNDGLQQFVDNENIKVGDTLTLSILTKENVLMYHTFAMTEGITVHTGYPQNNAWTSAAGFANGRAAVYPLLAFNQEQPISINIVAVKLEKGDKQTLAHNEGTDESPIWILNETPNYDDELTRCLRYLRYINAPNNLIIAQAQAWATYACNGIIFADMARTPTIEGFSNLAIRKGSSNMFSTSVRSVSVGYVANYYGGITVTFTCDLGLLTEGEDYQIKAADDNAYLVLSCE